MICAKHRALGRLVNGLASDFRRPDQHSPNIRREDDFVAIWLAAYVHMLITQYDWLFGGKCAYGAILLAVQCMRYHLIGCLTYFNNR